MARSGANFPERMQFRRPRRSKQEVPCVGTNPHDAGKASFNVAKLHRAKQRSEFSTERPQDRAIVGTRFYCHDQKDRGAGERCGYGLRDGR